MNRATRKRVFPVRSTRTTKQPNHWVQTADGFVLASDHPIPSEERLREAASIIEQFLEYLGDDPWHMVGKARDFLAGISSPLSHDAEGESATVSREGDDLIERAAVAEQIIGQIEDRFPDWQSYRDLIDCIDCTLHHLRDGHATTTERGRGNA